MAIYTNVAYVLTKFLSEVHSAVTIDSQYSQMFVCFFRKSANLASRGAGTAGSGGGAWVGVWEAGLRSPSLTG